MAVNKDGVYIAEDKDFQNIDGYWIYKGELLEVDITDFVNSKKLTSTRYMFSGLSTYGSTAVKRVVLGENSVNNMYRMFNSSQATSLDLSSFNTSNVTTMANMFSSTQATTGYARTQTDADNFNSSSRKPSGLVFVVGKPRFGTLNNLKIKSMLHKDSNGIIKQVKTLKFKDNLGNITKLK